MKLMKKIAAALLAATLVLSMSMTAMAASSITIENANEGHTYTAYQIFAGNGNADSSMTDIVWGLGINTAGKTAYGDANDKATEISAYTEEQLLDFANEIMEKYLGASSASASAPTDGKYVIPGLDDGYYLITDQVSSATGVEDGVSAYIVEVVGGNITVTPKSSVPSFEKKVKDINDSTETTYGQWQDSADYDKGDTVKFQLSVTLPDDYANFETYYLSFEDDLSDGLQLQAGTINVYLNDSLIANKSTIDAKTNEYKFDTNDTDTDDFKLSILDLKKSANSAVAGDKIVVTYDATLLDTAVVGAAGNPNTAFITYQNNPNYTGSIAPGGYGEEDKPDADGDGTPDDTDDDFDVTDTNGDGIPDQPSNDPTTDKDGDGIPNDSDNDDNNNGIPDTEENDGAKDVTGDSAKDVVKVFTFELVVNKVDKDRNPLDGAHFALYKEDVDDADTSDIPEEDGYDTYHLVKELTSGTTFTFSGLDDGNYLLVETQVPDANYNSIDPIEFTIVAEHEEEDADPSLTSLTITPAGLDFTAVASSGVITADIVNYTGTQLPTTGGIGTTIFYIVGGILVIGAGVLLVTKKRMENK